jgi:hypothetical protein
MTNANIPGMQNMRREGDPSKTLLLFVSPSFAD